MTITPTEVTPGASLAGGLMIGLVAVLMMALLGRITGISGIASRLVPPVRDGATLGRLAFVLGLVMAPAAWTLGTGHVPSLAIDATLPVLLVAGLLVGFGSVWGYGCTSGHGVCGLARFSGRSVLATLVFMAVAMGTVFLIRHGGGVLPW